MLLRSAEVTLERAAEIAGYSLWEMVELLKEESIAYNLGIEAIKSRLENEKNRHQRISPYFRQ